MRTGKLPEQVLRRAVLGQIRKMREEVLSGAGIGRDCATFPFQGDGPLVTCMQEAVIRLRVDEGKKGEGRGETYPRKNPDSSNKEIVMTMGELLQKCANNLAAGGNLPLAVMLTFLLPEETEEREIRDLMGQAEEKCGELSMEIIGGQTRVTSAVGEPVAVVTGYGKTIKNKCFTGRCVPGQEIVLSKWVGLQGTALLVQRNRQRLLERYPAYLVEEAKSFGRYLSVLPEAAIALRTGACAMHDASEGGIFGALWELAEKSGVGLRIRMRELPLRQETVEVCECCNVNPYELLSGGCLVMACEDGQALAEALEAEHIPAAVVGRVTEGNSRILLNGEEIRYLNRPGRDAVYQD